MVLVQKWPFIKLFFLGIVGKENVFYNIQEPKNTFLGYKNTKFKKSKNWNFSKGVNPWFWSKKSHFSNLFFLGSIRHENVFYEILEPKNTFQGYKNQKFKKSKNWHFSKGVVNPRFWSENGHFSNFFFLGIIVQENVFYNILEPKNTFLGYKNTKFKKSKNWHFSKRVNPWFWSKNSYVFNFFFLGNIGQEHVFYDIIEAKNTFLGYKKKRLKSRKIDIFPKGLTHGFSPKMAIFPTFFFR